MGTGIKIPFHKAMSFSYRGKKAARESKLGSRAVSSPVKIYNLRGLCP